MFSLYKSLNGSLFYQCCLYTVNVYVPFCLLRIIFVELNCKIIKLWNKNVWYLFIISLLYSCYQTILKTTRGHSNVFCCIRITTETQYIYIYIKKIKFFLGGGGYIWITLHPVRLSIFLLCATPLTHMNLY